MLYEVCGAWAAGYWVGWASKFGLYCVVTCGTVWYVGYCAVWLGDGEIWETTRSRLLIAASHGLFGEKLDGDWLNWLLVEGTETGVPCHCCWGVATEGAPWVVATHCG